jgi:hypothetical protein
MYYVWASKRFEARPGEKCQDHRQRWPQIEGIIQVIGRSLIIVIHFAPLYIILIAEQTHWDWPIITYFAVCICSTVVYPRHRNRSRNHTPVLLAHLFHIPQDPDPKPNQAGTDTQSNTQICWSILICLVEIVSLTAPGSFFTLRRFPRLPSKFLSVAEFCALFLTMFNMHEILRPNWRARDEKGRLVADLACPIDTCVTKDEYYGIAVFQCQLVAL